MTRTAVRPTPPSRRRPGIRAIHAAGLAVAAAGVMTEYLTGVPGFPTVPPGPIILVIAALTVALVPWRWTPALGVLVAVFLAVGTVAAGTTAGVLATPIAPGPFLGAVIQVAGLIVALLAGVAALIAAGRGR